MRTLTLVAGCLALIAFHPACGKDGKDKKKGSGETAKDQGKTAKTSTPDQGDPGKKTGGDIEAAKRTINLEGFDVEIEVPVGWQEKKFGDGLLFTKPGDGLYNSTFNVGTSCEGGCTKIAENIKVMADEQVKMHEYAYPTAKIVHQGDIAEGGGEFQLDLAKKDGSKAAQYKIAHFQEGWPKAVVCIAMALGDDAKHIDKLKAMCKGMQITPKAK